MAHLSLVTAACDVPMALWRDRLALTVSEVCLGFSGQGDGRVAAYLTRPGDDPGSAGRILRQWSRAVGQPISAAMPDLPRLDFARARDVVANVQRALCYIFGKTSWAS